MHANVVDNMGLNAQDIGDLSRAWTGKKTIFFFCPTLDKLRKALKKDRFFAANIQAIEKATIAAGGFLVQMFTDPNRVLAHGNCEKFFQKAVRQAPPITQ